jgi:hypothetical protein
MDHGPRRVRMAWMEDLMLGSRRTVPLWRPRRLRLLALERALVSTRGPAATSRDTSSEQTIIDLKSVPRMAAAAKAKAMVSSR